MQFITITKSFMVLTTECLFNGLSMRNWGFCFLVKCSKRDKEGGYWVGGLNLFMVISAAHSQNLKPSHRVSMNITFKGICWFPKNWEMDAFPLSAFRSTFIGTCCIILTFDILQILQFYDSSKSDFHNLQVLQNTTIFIPPCTLIQTPSCNRNT